MKIYRSGVLLFTAAVFSVCLGIPETVHAQTAAGSILGSVTDSSGALIPEVKVTATNTATGVPKTASTTATGAYLIPSLDSGTYTVTFERGGFQKQVNEDVLVVMNTATTVNVSLTVGAITQTVTVVAQATPIIRDQGDRGTIITPKILESLPLSVTGASRDLASFIVLTPGVTGDTFMTRFNGGATFSQELMVDGQPFLDSDHPGAFEVFRPVFEGVDEFKVTINTYSARYGHGVAQESFHFASGTNAFHGDVFEFLRNNALDARGFFPATVTPYKQNEYGFTVGGPWYIPKVYDGRNRTFFHFSWGAMQYRGASSTNLTTFPTAEMLQGNFSHFTDAQGNVIPIYDPATTRSNGAGGVTRDQFQCNGVQNVICPDRFSAISKLFLPLMPASTIPGKITNNALAFAAGADTREMDWTAKVDHNISDRYVFHGSYQSTRNHQLSSPPYNSPLATYGFNPYYSYAPRVSLDMSLRPNLQNTVAAQYTRLPGSQLIYPNNTTVDSIVSPKGIQFPAFGIAGYVGYGAGGTGNYALLPATGFLDNLTWVKGRHTLQMGTDIRFTDESRKGNVPWPGVYNFSNKETSLPDSTNFASLGSSFASFLLGSVDNFQQTPSGGWHLFKTGYRAFYFQDDIKVTPKFTLNLGLRWDHYSPVTQKFDLMSNFNPDLPNPAAGNIPGVLVFAGNKWGGSCIPSGASLCRHSFADSRYNNWQPRLGFAYQLNPRTVVRGGAGLTYFLGGALSMWDGTVTAGYQAGFRNQISTNSPDNGISPSFQWDVPGAIPSPVLSPISLGSGVGGSIDFMDRSAGKAPYQWNYSLTIERELPWQISVEASYAGTTSFALGTQMENLNQLQDKYLSLGNELNADISCVANNTCPNAIAAGAHLPYPGFTGPVSQALRPYPQYTAIHSVVQENGMGKYNSFQLRVQKYYTQGASFLVSYTASKLLTNAGYQFAAFNGYATDTYNRKLEWGLSSDDTPQRLVASGTYELPIGPGKRFLNSRGPVGKVLGGWNATAIVMYVSGTPINIGGGQPIPNYGGTTRPDLLGGANPLAFTGGKFDPAVDRYLNASAFAQPAPFTYGTSPIYLPNARNFGTKNESFALIKRTTFGANEVRNLEFRAEFFNLFNRTRFGSPNGNVNDTAGFGSIGGQANEPRLIQFGLKLNW